MSGEAETTTTTEATTTTEKTLAQSEVNAIVAREKADAATKAQKELLKSLGFESPDDLKAIVDFGKQAKEASQTAEERAAALAQEREQAAQERDNFKAEADRYKESVAALVATEVEAVPEDRRSLIPDYDDPAKVLDFISKNRTLLVGTPAPTAVGGGGSPALTPQSGVDFESYKKLQPLEKSAFMKAHPEEAARFSAMMRGQ